MKTLLFIIAIFSYISGYSQEVKIGGIKGLTWGMSKKEAKKVLASKYQNVKADSIRLTVPKATFASRKARILFSFQEDSLFSIGIIFDTPLNVRKMLLELREKFGEPNECVPYFQNAGSLEINEANYDALQYDSCYNNYMVGYKESLYWISQDNIAVHAYAILTGPEPDSIYLEYQNIETLKRMFERLKTKMTSDY